MRNTIKTIESIIPRDFSFCDVGARWGMEQPWKSFREVITAISFEPDKEEYESLMGKKNQEDMIYPYALWNKKKHMSLYLTKARGCSSFYKPNYDFLKNYCDSSRFQIEATFAVETTSIDDLYRDKILPDIDFLKIDAQGAELNILKGGETLLDKYILGVQVEVEFQPMYENQPLFPEIDLFIRNELGLHLQDIRKSYWKYPEGINVGASKGQLIFGDALYFRSPHEITSWCASFSRDEASTKLHMACLMGVIYGYLDYSLCLLNQPSLCDFLDIDKINSWKNLIHQYGKSLHYKGKGVDRLSSFFQLLARMFHTHEWSSIGHHLGSRKKLGVFR